MREAHPEGFYFVNVVAAGSSMPDAQTRAHSLQLTREFGDHIRAHAIVLEAGRRVLDHGTGEALRYNKVSLLNPWFIVE